MTDDLKTCPFCILHNILMRIPWGLLVVIAFLALLIVELVVLRWQPSS